MVIRAAHRARTKGLRARYDRLDLRKRQAAYAGSLYPDRLVESLCKLRVVIVELTPAATQHGLTRAEQVVGQAEARSIVESAVSESGERHAAVLLVPVKTGTRGFRRAWHVQSGVPDGEAESLPVVPRAKMRRAKAIVHGQPLVHPPAIHTEKLECFVSLVMQVAEIRFLIAAHEAVQQVRIWAATTAPRPASFRDKAVRIGVVRLIVDHILVVRAELRRVRAPHLRNCVADRREVLLREKTFAPAGLEPARIEYCGEFSTPTRYRWNLVDAVVEDSVEWNV